MNHHLSYDTKSEKVVYSPMHALPTVHLDVWLDPNIYQNTPHIKHHTKFIFKSNKMHAFRLEATDVSLIIYANCHTLFVSSLTMSDHLAISPKSWEP